MSKRIAFLGSAAALAASVLIATSAAAFAQTPRGPAPHGQVAAAPQEYRGPGDTFENGRYGDRDRGPDRDWDRGRAPDFQRAQESCSRAAIQEAWRRGFYSAQYEGGPRIVETRNGWQMEGRMRVHGHRGYSYHNTVCELRRGGEAVNFWYK